MDHDTDTCPVASALLGLEGLAVLGVEAAGDGTRLVHVSGVDTTVACPGCGVVSRSVKGQVTTCPRDLAVFGVPVRLVWHKRRWRCRVSACPVGSFTETVAQVPARARVTGRLRAAAGAAVADGGRTVAQSGRDHGLSWPVVHAAFTAHAQAVLADEPAPVPVLGIDETRRGRPVFTLNPDTGVLERVTDRWHTGFVDIEGGQGLLGQVQGRRAADVAAWLAARPESWRAQVKVVAIDMCAAFRAAVRQVLPHALLVVDHFHLVQLANHALNLVRRRVTATLRGRRARKTDPEHGIKRRLLRNREDLPPAKFADMWNRLIDLGPPGEEILCAWIAKEELRSLLALAGTHPPRSQIADRLWRFYRWCADTSIDELHRLATTIEAWWPHIEAFLTTGVTNAASEGYNRLIKLEARNAFGFRNPTNQQLRSRCATTRATRRRDKPD